MAVSEGKKDTEVFQRASRLWKEIGYKYTVSYLMWYIEEWDKAVTVFKS